MDTASVRDQRAPAGPEPIGRVTGITGSEATIELTVRPQGGSSATVGKFLGVMTSKSVIVGLITEVGEEILAPIGGQAFRSVAKIDFIGAIRAQGTAAQFERGVLQYPNIGDDRDSVDGSGIARDLRRQQSRPRRRRTSAAESEHRACTSTSSSSSAGISPSSAPPASANRAASPSSCRRFSRPGRTCASFWSIRTTNMAAASATRRWC